MNDLTESVQDNGIMEPLTVRPLEDTDNYEIISGHRRYHATKKAGLAEVPAFIRAVNRDEAAIMLVDSNLHRERILPSEKAFAYKLKAEALNHQGKRDTTSGQIVPKSDDNRATAQIGEQTGESYKTVQRYIRLTNLIPELLDMMDKGMIAFSVGVELSFLDDQLQYDVLNACEENDNTPSYAQAVRMHKAYAAGELDRDGTLIATYSHRNGPNGIRAMISRDDGETWETGLTLWNGNHNWDCGYPASVELNDGNILTVFYAHETPAQPAEIFQIVWKLEE